ncbi:MAG TPA: hypothetical protein VIG08_01755 [Gemmatimonadales bacterium]|jgi:uncharacterized cupredoxin-like copper-binding protein
MTRIECSRLIATVALLGAVASACSTAASSERADSPRSLTIRAAEFSFSAPDTIVAGLVSLQLENDGSEMHHVQLVRINSGHTFSEFRDSAVSGHPFPSWVTPVGGPNVTSPGADTRVVVGLAEGQYAMLCLIPSPGERHGHFTKGMIRPLVVIPGNGEVGGEPGYGGRILLSDYAFNMTPALRAGRRTLRVENTASQPHEVVIMRLLPGKTLDDLSEWVKDLKGPMPAEPNGGTTEIAPGAANLLTTTFVPGDYVLVCFVMDRFDGRSHLSHGMVRQIRVD